MRVRGGMGVSIPVAWEEQAQLRGGAHWCLSNASQRLPIGNAPWTALFRSVRSLHGPMRRLGDVPDSDD